MTARFPTRQIKRLGGHNGPAHALGYSSASAQYILTGCTDRLIRLYNPSHTAPTPDTPLKPIQTYQGHGYEVLDLSVSSDNGSFVSCGGDKAVYVWDVASARVLRRLSGHAGRVECVRWAGEGDSLVVSGSFDASVKIWDMKSNAQKPLMNLTEARDSVGCVAVFGWEVMAGSVDGRVRVYDVRMGQCYVDVIGHPVTSLQPTKDGSSMLLSTLDSTLRLMDKSTGKMLQSYKAPDYVNTTYRIRSTLGSSDATIISGSENGSILVWDLLTGDVKHELRHSSANKQGLDGKGKGDVVSAVAWCPTRNEWCSSAGDGNVVVWGS